MQKETGEFYFLFWQRIILPVVIWAVPLFFVGEHLSLYWDIPLCLVAVFWVTRRESVPEGSSEATSLAAETGD